MSKTDGLLRRVKNHRNNKKKMYNLRFDRATYLSLCILTRQQELTVDETSENRKNREIGVELLSEKSIKPGD